MRNSKILKLPINFKELAEKHGVRKGRIFFSPVLKSFVIEGHPDIDLICIEPPVAKGQVIDGNIVQDVIINENMWCAVFQNNYLTINKNIKKEKK